MKKLLEGQMFIKKIMKTIFKLLGNIFSERGLRFQRDIIQLYLLACRTGYKTKIDSK
jgi:hypothetical protein